MEYAMEESKDLEVKVVLLGKQNGGKSCLVVRYLHKRYNPEKISTTIGAAYGTNIVQVEDSHVTLGIWDTAGSERYNAMSRIYYRGAKAAVVCYDLTDSNSFETAKFWISELKKYEEQCKVYLCGTKLDLIHNDSLSRTVDPSITSTYAMEIDAKLFETSSKTGHNVDELFYEIAKDSIKTEADQVRRKETQAILFENSTPKRKPWIFRC